MGVQIYSQYPWVPLILANINKLDSHYRKREGTERWGIMHCTCTYIHCLFIIYTLPVHIISAWFKINCYKFIIMNKMLEHILVWNAVCTEKFSYASIKVIIMWWLFCFYGPRFVPLYLGSQTNSSIKTTDIELCYRHLFIYFLSQDKINNNTEQCRSVSS